MPLRASWALAALLAACTAAAGAWVARDLAPAAAPQLASGTWLPHPRGTGAFALVDARGVRFTQASLAGRPSLLFFGFTHCPDVCPATLAAIARVLRAPGVPALRVVLVTLDPERDTPAVLGRYVRAFDPRFIGLTGSAGAIRGLAKRLDVGYERVPLPGGDYTIDHVGVVFLLDGAGRIVAVFTTPLDGASFGRDLRRAGPFLRG